MSVTVYKMSGESFFVSIFDGFRVRNLRNEVYDILRKDLDIRYDRDSLIFFSLQNEEIDDDNDFVNDHDEFHVFVKDIEDRIPSRLRLSLADNNVICLRLEDGFLIDYYGWNVEDRIDEFADIEPQVNIPNSPLVIEVDLSDEVCEVMRRDIMNDMNENYNEQELEDNEEVFNIFFERFIRLDNFQHNIDFVYI